jgi:cold-inducible RNA-binding protein
MNIYVGNISYQASDDDLLEVFEAIGSVDSASIIFDRYSGRSKGFGFVEMPNDEEATRAIEELDGKELLGRPLKVNQARPREDRPRRGGGGGGGGYGGDDYDSRY